MDEILIEEKRYVSSKRAAKMTGYAKDYIGQLCREGRVPARLVGRSWYVLETAIQDHRFADKKNDQEIESAAPASGLATSTWESPRYETFPADALPSVNRLRNEEPLEPGNEENKVAQSLQDSWKAWFEHIGTQIHLSTTTGEEKIEEEKKEENKVNVLEVGGDTDVNIPIHVVYEPLPKELLPNRARPSDDRWEEQSTGRERGETSKKWVIRLSVTAGALVAAVLAALAVVSSGYFDAYIISLKQAGVISGAILHIK